MNRRGFLATCAALAALPGCSTPGVRLDVPYVSTPHEVVRAMLGLARVTPADVLYDLGCGDGRLVIAAALDHGARGVGIDIDPARLEEAGAAAQRAGVTSRVSFVREDFFRTDLSRASVVTMFLLPEINARLAPKFRRELRPGSRIVSYRYGMGDWAPEDGTTVQVDGTNHDVYLWRVPA